MCGPPKDSSALFACSNVFVEDPLRRDIDHLGNDQERSGRGVAYTRPPHSHRTWHVLQFPWKLNTLAGPPSCTAKRLAMASIACGKLVTAWIKTKFAYMHGAVSPMKIFNTKT